MPEVRGQSQPMLSESRIAEGPWWCLRIGCDGQFPDRNAANRHLSEEGHLFYELIDTNESMKARKSRRTIELLEMLRNSIDDRTTADRVRSEMWWEDLRRLTELSPTRASWLMREIAQKEGEWK